MSPLLAQQAGPEDWLSCGVRFASIEERASLFGVSPDLDALTYILPVMSEKGPVQLYRREFSLQDDEFTITDRHIGFFFPEFTAHDPSNSMLNHSFNMDETVQFLEDEICGEPQICVLACTRGDYHYEFAASSGEYVSLDGQVAHVIGRMGSVSFEPADPTQDPGEPTMIFIPDFLADDPPLLQNVLDVSDWALLRTLAEAGLVGLSVQELDSFTTEFHSDDSGLTLSSSLSDSAPSSSCQFDFKACVAAAKHDYKKAKAACNNAPTFWNGLKDYALAWSSCAGTGTLVGGVVGAACGIPGGPAGMAASGGVGAAVGGVSGACIGGVTGQICCLDEWFLEEGRCLARAKIDFLAAKRRCKAIRKACKKSEANEFSALP